MRAFNRPNDGDKTYFTIWRNENGNSGALAFAPTNFDSHTQINKSFNQALLSCDSELRPG